MPLTTSPTIWMTGSLRTSVKTLGLAAAGLAGALAFATAGFAATDPSSDKAPAAKPLATKAQATKAQAPVGPATKSPASKPQVATGKPSADKAPANKVPAPVADALPPKTEVTPPSATKPADSGPATTGAIPTGKVSGLPVPRYVSLKTDRVNLREGPSKDNRTAWVFQRAGLPVEITAEYETWRRIRDAEGTEGWVLHSLLSGRRTALVMPWAKAGAEALPLFSQADDRSQMVARLQPNVIANVKTCRDGWCRVIVSMPDSRDVGGYMRQDKLWGVYPNEKVE